MNSRSDSSDTLLTSLKEETKPLEETSDVRAQGAKSGLNGEEAVLAIWGRFGLRSSLLCQK